MSDDPNAGRTRYVIHTKGGKHLATVFDLAGTKIPAGAIIDETTEVCPPGHRWCPKQKRHIHCDVQTKHHEAATQPTDAERIVTLEERIAKLEAMLADRAAREV